MRWEKALAAALACAVTVTCVSGCSLFTRRHGSNGDYTVSVIEDEADIPNDSYYVAKADGTYHKPYLGMTSYMSDSAPYQADPMRVCWFGKDFDRIPTMYKGEEIVYRSSQEFTPSFYLERYQDIGYTIGISGLAPAKDGRYSFSTDPRSGYIDGDSAARELFELGSHTATLEKIGGVQLRSGNISQAGTILGLEHGRRYKLDVYIGTEVNEYTIAADVRAFSSFEMIKLTDYEYTGGNVITVRLPKALESGYYVVCGYGMFRYIDSEREYNEDMDMNVPNRELTLRDPFAEEDENSGPDDFDWADEAGNRSRQVTERFRIDEDCRVKITLEWMDSDSGFPYPAPRAKAVGENGVFSLSEDEGDTESLSGTFDMPAGDYTLEIDGLFDRDYTYKVVRQDDGKGN